MAVSHETPSRFHFTGLSADPFRHLFGLSDEALAKHHAQRRVADARPGFPDRIALRDAEIGESVILVDHTRLTRPVPMPRAARCS